MQVLQIMHVWSADLVSFKWCELWINHCVIKLNEHCASGLSLEAVTQHSWPTQVGLSGPPWRLLSVFSSVINQLLFSNACQTGHASSQQHPLSFGISLPYHRPHGNRCALIVDCSTAALERGVVKCGLDSARWLLAKGECGECQSRLCSNPSVRHASISRHYHTLFQINCLTAQSQLSLPLHYLPIHRKDAFGLFSPFIAIFPSIR